MHDFVTLLVHRCFALRVQHLIVLRFHTPICGNRLRALWLSAQHFAAAEALPMLMPDEPEDGFLSRKDQKPRATGREPLPGRTVVQGL